jgi:hypothetical protein
MYRTVPIRNQSFACLWLGHSYYSPPGLLGNARWPELWVRLGSDLGNGRTCMRFPLRLRHSDADSLGEACNLNQLRTVKHSCAGRKTEGL